MSSASANGRTPGTSKASCAAVCRALVPHTGGLLLGVWDVDSPNLARFDDDDRAGMEALCAVFMRAAEAG